MDDYPKDDCSIRPFYYLDTITCIELYSSGNPKCSRFLNGQSFTILGFQCVSHERIGLSLDFFGEDSIVIDRQLLK